MEIFEGTKTNYNIVNAIKIASVIKILIVFHLMDQNRIVSIFSLCHYDSYLLLSVSLYLRPLAFCSAYELIAWGGQS